MADNAIPPGKVFKYIWQVPERAGPTGNNGNCLSWSYFSDAFSVKDFYTGLVGPLVVCKKVIVLLSATQYLHLSCRNFSS